MQSKEKKETTLRFSPYAWAKLLFMRDQGNTEVSGFGITDEEDPLLVVDFCLLPQEASAAFVEFDDGAIGDFMDDCLDEDIHPVNCTRVWIHTHPGFSASPSHHDLKEFEKVFDDCDWAVMFILGAENEYTARLKYTFPLLETDIKTQIDWNMDFEGSDTEAWEAEYKEFVKKKVYIINPPNWVGKGKQLNTKTKQGCIPKGEFPEIEETFLEYDCEEDIREAQVIWDDGYDTFGEDSFFYHDHHFSRYDDASYYEDHIKKLVEK